jgi:hypothetical protein
VSDFARFDPAELDSPESDHGVASCACSPAVAATHRGKNELFRVGRTASFGLKEIAENGNNGPMLTRLGSDDDVSDVVEAPGGPLVPAGSPGDAMFGQSTTFSIEAVAELGSCRWQRC